MNGEIMQRRVRVLPSSLANQIAAGEVVERPASVAKELLENSLDAGARRIDINVERGGTRLVRIRDDGCGIHRDDLALALDRHATSKIATLDELEHVRSLGFRGEALPSIASVSRLSLSSRIAGDERGWRITAEGREPTDPLAPIAHPVGTTLEVRELFFNTPARRKFLRAEKTELRHIEDVVRRIALSRADVALALRHGERTLLSVAPARGEEGLGARLAKVCGAGFMKHALAVEFEGAGLALRGWIGLPSFTRSQSDLQHFFVNGRMVRDSLINHAIRQTYQDVLYPGRYPAYVLYLELDPAQVDVNVHPTKHEVRFRETRLVHDFLVSQLSRALSDGGERPPLAHPVLESRARAGANDVSSARMGTPARRMSSIRDQAASYAALASAQSAAIPGGLTAGAKDTPPLGFALARVHELYLLAENADGLVLVDLRAARERLARARFKAALAGDEIHSQPLLLPANVTLGADGARVLEIHSTRLATLGIEVGRASPESIWVRRLPSVLKDVDVSELLHDLAELGISVSDEALLATVASHAGAGAAASPSLVEMNALLRDLEGLGVDADASMPWVQLSNEDLAALFMRKS